MANAEDLGRYRLKRLLGRGALGEVWEAADGDTGAKVAVKIMHAADDELVGARIHFAREARVASELNHPNVVRIRDAGEAAGTSFLVMDMVEGPTLRELLAKGDSSIADRLRWLREIGGALSAMHRAGMAHRDLKAENVIVRPDASACLVDLGISKWTKFELGGEREPDEPFPDESSGPTTLPEYVPPETKSENLYDDLGDQFAWGVLAYEALTGELPGDEAKPLGEWADLPLTPKAAKAFDRARAAAREERWTTMSEVMTELANGPLTVSAAAAASEVAGVSGASGEEPVPPTAPSAVSAPRSSPPRPLPAPAQVPVVTIAIAVVFVGLAVAGLLALR